MVPLFNFTFHFNLATHCLHLVFCDEQPNTSCIAVAMKGFVHTKNFGTLRFKINTKAVVLHA